MKTQSLKVPNHISALDDISQALEEFCAKTSIQHKLKLQLNLVLEELITNTIKYGYEDKKEHFIHIEFFSNSTDVHLKITDDALPFNLLEYEGKDNEVEKPVDERSIGGVGILLVHTLMDEISYQRDSGRNVLLLSKSYS